MLLRDGAATFSINEAVSLARGIFWFTVLVEAAGVVCLELWFLVFAQLPLAEAAWQGIFYWVTAFCSAGFAISRVAGHTNPATNPILNVLLIVLIQLGAISFMVCKDAYDKRAWRPLALDSKLVLALNGALLLFGTLVFLATEWGEALADIPVASKALVSLIFLLLYGLGAAGLSASEHLFSHRKTPMIELRFEAMSALATVGVSTGITPGLTAVSKRILCLLMFVGHLGPLATVYALQRRQRPHRYRFPDGAVRIG